MSTLSEIYDSTHQEIIPLVLACLQDLCTQGSLDPLKKLFWTHLAYKRVNQILPFHNWRDASTLQLQTYLYPKDPLLLFATNEREDFDIIYIRLVSSALPLTHERLIINNLLKDHPDALFIFSNATQDKWHFVNVKPDNKDAKRRILRRITVSQEEQLRTASERLALLDVATIIETSPLFIQELHDEAFDVAAVTKTFFDAYKKQFRALQENLYSQIRDITWAHDYAHLFLNRCMFLYFIQRKGWLTGDKKFLRTLWNTYNETPHEEDTFFEHWLQVLFLDAFNQKFHLNDERYTYFPIHVKQIFAEAPFLGGLFAPDPLDEQKYFILSDACFYEILAFFEGYNFTIAEDSPLDQEVAVDPEMIGRVYESLVNVSSEVDERGDAGIFYTPRSEIDLMCRLTLVDYLANHLPHIQKGIFYDIVFALYPHEKLMIDEDVKVQNYWETIYTHVSEVTVLDPACGSGAFLVGMLDVLDDLQARASSYLRRRQKETKYERRKRITGQSLYGVDVMAWAARVAELRLWLKAAVESDLPLNKLHDRRDPILPHFTFKIRHGDSLLQQVGNVTFAHNQTTRGITSMLHRRLIALQEEKGKFYNSDASCMFKTSKEVKEEERAVFVAIIQEREDKLENEIAVLESKLALPEQSTFLDSSDEENIIKVNVEVEQWKKEIETKADELDTLRKVHTILANPDQEIPFVWDIGFVEIFSNDHREGFDIVIGNPPYVRQENISNPLVPRREVDAEKKREYKRLLAQIAHQAFPDFFLYNLNSQKAFHELDAKSDLYVYFYLHGLHLLNAHGSFCFITSNSWLDVGYGAVLQEFLLQYCKVKMIIDNAAKRSFATADVNTVIVLLSPPGTRDRAGQDAITRFVLFTVDFEQVLASEIFKHIESTTEPITTLLYRTYPINQRALFDEGSTLLKGKQSRTIGTKRQNNVTQHALTQVSSYTGNKLGGKYLRAPDIYWVLMQKGRDRLVHLRDITEVRYGVKTGANEFFYLDEKRAKQWHIEEEFLQPIIKSPTDCRSILVQSSMLKNNLFLCQKTKAELKGTAALEYIQWGESQGFHKNSSVSGRGRWWSVSTEAANSIFVKEAHNTSAVFYNPNMYSVDCRLYYAKLSTTTLVYLNSAIGALLFEIYNRAGLGGGARSMMVSDYTLVPVLNGTTKTEAIAESVFQPVYNLPARKLVLSEEQKHKEMNSNLFDIAWHNLDDFIFDIFGLTTTERDAVYEAVIHLVGSRLKKATSLQTSKPSETVESSKHKMIVNSTNDLWAGSLPL